MARCSPPLSRGVLTPEKAWISTEGIQSAVEDAGKAWETGRRCEYI
jgi:hypothetical protein